MKETSSQRGIAQSIHLKTADVISVQLIQHVTCFIHNKSHIPILTTFPHIKSPPHTSCSSIPDSIIFALRHILQRMTWETYIQLSIAPYFTYILAV